MPIKQQDNIRIFSKFVFDKPEMVVKILNNNGIKTTEKVTLSEIIEKSMTEIYNENLSFISDIDNALKNQGYLNIAGVIVGGALSIASSIFGSRQAKKARELQARIAIAQLETEKLLAEEELRVYGEVERTRILANSLEKYRSNLQVQSTARQKNVYVYLIAIACGIGIIYSSTVLIKSS